MAVVFCRSCGASNRADQEACAECGLVLDPPQSKASSAAADPTGRRARRAPGNQAAPRSGTHRQRRPASNVMTMVVIGGVVALAATGIIWYSLSQPATRTGTYSGLVFPDGLRARVDEFRAAWSSANVAALAGFYGEDEEQREKQLRKRFEHVGWNGKLPVLGDPHLHSSYRGNAGDYVAFAAPTGTVRTAWTRDGNQWNLTHLYLE